MKYALGIIETVGLAAAIEAADTAVKSANIRLIGYELTKGDGMTTVKIEGDVGAVQAGIEAARSAASLVNRVVSVKVIPRPSDDLESLIRNKDTVGYTLENSEITKNVKTNKSEVHATPEIEIKAETQLEIEIEADIEEEPNKVEVVEIQKSKTVCNICHDPNCTRKKGEQKRYCIHYFDHRKDV